MPARTHSKTSMFVCSFEAFKGTENGGMPEIPDMHRLDPAVEALVQ
ncbi:MAG: hypothetical protein P8M25_09000 [Paracoccaceae bacterium]|nr:hypothetical protein [Paracoccaceae bacterium]